MGKKSRGKKKGIKPIDTQNPNAGPNYKKEKGKERYRNAGKKSLVSVD